ncbi:MAG: cyclic nucleotide-binding domain-containing protein [Lentisphaerae bacterium]|nr:cyclic nucleotide-binding domain-containing protein [Lentisphaerota bacterium]
MDIRNNCFLSFFDEAQAHQLAESAQIRKFNAGDTIFREGDHSDAIYLSLNGSVRLVKHDPSGHDQLLATVKAGDYFGEFGVLDGKPRSTGAVAAEPCTELARLSEELVWKVINASEPKVILNIALHIIGKIRSTNERYVEERLRKERMTLTGEMAGAIIHDFKNPFAVIVMAASLLRMEKADPSKFDELCHLIEAQVSRMQTMADEVLEFSRGKPQLFVKPVELEAFLNRFSRLNVEYLKSLGVEFEIGRLVKTVEMDADKILRILQNLVNNAVEAFGEKKGRVRVRAEDRDDHVLLSVSDNGPGIPEHLRARVFEPFTTHGKPKGTGLGMAIAKSFVEAHHGRLWFESVTGKGTAFFIQLPVQQPPATG